jgi:peptide/nickel transport system permease protein
VNPHFVVRRLAQVLPTVLAIVLAAFVLIHIAPGDPVLILAGDHGDQAYYAAMRERFGLDRSLPEQVIAYFGSVMRGDFGYSWILGREVSEVIAERFVPTLMLTGSALVLAIAAGIPLGIAAARNSGRLIDISTSLGSLLLYSTPVFLIAQVAMLWLSLSLGWFPIQGMTSVDSAAGGNGYWLDVLRHLALPAAVLASQELAILTRLVRVGLLEELARDHVRTARAKGAGEASVLLRHAFPRAILPTVTVIGSRVAHLLAGAMIVEIIFGWPGMGRLLLGALQGRDAPLLLGIFFVISFSVVLANLVTDLVHAALDPRIELV